MYTSMRYSLVLALVLVGCGTENPFDRGPEYDDGTAVLPPAAETVSFKTDILPILNQCTSCHAGGTGGWTYDGGAEA